MEPPPAIDRATASSAHPWLACQARYGVHIRTASSPPAYSQREVNGRRGPATASPTTTANIRKATRSLSIRPSPARSPTASHSRSAPVRRMRTISQHSSAQTSRSKTLVFNVWPDASTTAATAIDVAASSCAPRRPPSSRGSRPVTATTAAAASADGSRSTTSDVDATSDISRAMSGTNGGWSG